MDAKQACDKLNGFNFQNRYLVGKFPVMTYAPCLDVMVHTVQHRGDGY